MVAPALFEAERHSLGEIAAARAAFLARAHSRAALRGGSSLVVNFGAMGVKRAFPVLVAPWTSLLSMGLAEKSVVVEDGVPDVATIMSVTLTFDRRAMDEYAASALLAAFKTLVENPYGLLL
jgi:pyruvate dehydrogenase E2 component (dihydrolipoamide acetyltransferase)